MDKYEYKLKTEQMLELMENGAYNRAAEIADTIDWKRVRNATMLTNVSDIYEKNGDYQKSYEILNIAYHRAEGSRKVLYRLCALALKTGNVDEAIDYYDDFIQAAPKDPNQHILKYKILRARRTPIEQQIEALEEFKKAEYIEEWAYELAKLYQEAGMTAECLEECDDLILWFSEGKYVYKAMELKMQYKPLTPSQQEKYDHRYEKIESETEEIPDLSEYMARQDELRNEEPKEDRPVLETETVETPGEIQEQEESMPDEETDMPEEETEEEPSIIDETVQRLTQRGIASTMKLQDALKSLLHPEPSVPEIIQEEMMEEDVPELEADIEEIESVADLELVNEYAGKKEKKKILVDKDLEELKAEPLDETMEIPPLGEDIEEPDVCGDEAADSEMISEDDVEDLLEDFIEGYEEALEDNVTGNMEREADPEDVLSEDYGIFYEEEGEELQIYDGEEDVEEFQLDDAEEDGEEFQLDDAEEDVEELQLDDAEEDGEEFQLDDAEEDVEEFQLDDAEEDVEEFQLEDTEEDVEEFQLDDAEEDVEEFQLEDTEEDVEEFQLGDTEEDVEELRLDDTEEDSEELQIYDRGDDEDELQLDNAEEKAEELQSVDGEEEELQLADAEGAAEEIPDFSDDMEEVYVDEGIEEAETEKNIKAERKKPVDDQIDGQLSIEDVLMGWGDESAEGVEMEEKKKKADPILPPDIQRLIDEIEGVLPEDSDPEPDRPSVKAEDELNENIGGATKQFRLDEIEEFLASQDDGIDDYEDNLPEGVDGHEQKGYSDEEYEDEYSADDYAEEYTDGDEDEYIEEYDDYEEEEYSAEYENEPEEDEYSELYEDGLEEEYSEEYEDEPAEEEYTSEYAGDYEEEEYPEEYEEEYDDGEYPDEYEDEYTEEEYTDEYEGEYSDEYEEADPGDIAAGLEEEFRPNPEHAIIQDDREIPDEDDDNMDILSATTPLSRKETAKLIATGKTAPLPLDEISDALSMSDTGFVVHGRYDLAAQSGIGTRAGLTEEQKKLFSYFVPVRGMSEQLVDVLENDRNCTNREGTSRTGNLLIIGNKGNGKTVLAVDVVKAIQKQRNIRQGKVAIVTGDSLNKKKISDIFDKLYGGALIIEKAGKMNEKTVARMNKAMERDTGEMLIVLEEQRKPLDRLLSSNREFRRKFTCRLEVPIFINDELVTFGQTYAQENGYRIDEMGILALYSRIDNLQREDHAVTVAEVKEVMDEAMEHSQKASAKKLVKRVFGKNTDDADRIILSEKDFNI